MAEGGDAEASTGFKAPHHTERIDRAATVPAPPAGDDPRVADDRSLRANVRARLFPARVEDDDRPAGAAPRRIGRFLVLRQLGQGGMGIVFSAYDEELDRRVAIKLLRTEIEESGTDGRARLLREAQAMAKLPHPNIAHVYEVGVYQERVFVAMEYVRGRNLRRWLEETGGIWREVLDMYIEAGRGLAAAHVAGIVHRDFKPENVLVGADGRPRVLDFGLARPSDDGPPLLKASDSVVLPRRTFDSRLTVTGSVMGTPAYMSPEQHRGLASGAPGDQFSFCVSLYEALYGERPFAGDTVVTLAEAVTSGRLRDPPRDTPVPAWVRQILVRGLGPVASQRFADMDELLDELGRRDVRKRWRAAMWLTGVGAGSAVFYGAALQLSDADDRERCQTAATQQADAIWGDAERDRVREAMLWNDRAYATHTWRTVQRVLDAYVEQWAVAYEASCIAAAESSDEEYQNPCLEELASNVAELTADLDATTVPEALPMVAALAPIGICQGTASGSVDELWRGLSSAQSVHDAGLVELGAGNVEDANAMLLESMALRQATLGETHPDVAVSFEALGRLALARGQPESAETLFEQALELLDQESGFYDGVRAAAHDGLGRALRRGGEHELALEALDKARRLRDGTGSLELADTVEALAELHRELGNTGPAAHWAAYAATIRGAHAKAGTDRRPWPSPPDSVKPPPTAKVNLTTKVGAVEISVDGILYCVTPCRFGLPVGRGEREITLTKDGYAPQVITWAPQRESDKFPPVAPMLAK